MELSTALVLEFIQNELKACDRQSADPCEVIDAKVLSLPDVDGSVMTAAGMGNTAKSRRRSGAGGRGGRDEHIYVIAITPGGQKTPVQLKTRPIFPVPAA